MGQWLGFALDKVQFPYNHRLAKMFDMMSLSSAFCATFSLQLNAQLLPDKFPNQIIIKDYITTDLSLRWTFLFHLDAGVVVTAIISQLPFSESTFLWKSKANFDDEKKTCLLTFAACELGPNKLSLQQFHFQLCFEWKFPASLTEMFFMAVLLRLVW